ncbi:DNA-3-methyladenine glycosylase I [Streptomyces antimycoticus]|uniref:DNA-3-methyladenine glycosylase I n=1 Tax=Streptomyces antimycoticus TaxID=68175 RepID=UPI00343DDC63
MGPRTGHQRPDRTPPVASAGTRPDVPRNRHMTDRRCAWALSSDAMAACHDTEWGRPAHDDRHLFEMLLLEGVQAGPSWSTVLTKRENYRRALEAAGAAVEVRPSWACRPRRRPHGPECRPGPAGPGRCAPAGACATPLARLGGIRL